MTKSQRLTKTLVIISLIVCVATFVLLAPSYVKAETVESNVLNIEYRGSTNYVTCGLYIMAQAINTIDDLTTTGGNISVQLRKIDQKIIFPIGIRLTGSISLYHTDTNTELKKVNIDHTFDCLNKSYTATLFNNSDFSKGNGRYTIDVNLKYQQGKWSTDCYKIVTIDHKAS